MNNEEKNFKFMQNEKEINMVKFQMLLKKQWKCYKKRTNKGRNNDSWIKQGKNNNYLPKVNNKKLQTKNGRKQFEGHVIRKIWLWYWRNFR